MVDRPMVGVGSTQNSADLPNLHVSIEEFNRARYCRIDPIHRQRLS